MRTEELTKCYEPLQKLRVRLGACKNGLSPPVTLCSESESESFTGDTPNDFISPGGSDGGEISPLNARVKRTWTHSHQTFQQRRQVNQGGHSSP